MLNTTQENLVHVAYYYDVNSLFDGLAHLCDECAEDAGEENFQHAGEENIEDLICDHCGAYNGSKEDWWV